jgi:hypothetical protein
MNRRGILGEGVLMMYRLVLVAFIAFIILGVSSVFYDHVIEVRDAEAVIMTRAIVDCFAPEGVIDLSVFGESDRERVLSYCGFDGEEVERFYVRVAVTDSEEEVVAFSQGDSGALWVLSIFEDIESVSEGMRKYAPGYSKRVYDAVVLDGGISGRGKIEVEVLVSHEI